MFNSQMHQNYRIIMLIKVHTLSNSKTDVDVNTMLTYFQLNAT